jgi:uncharacterized protein (TIGR00255 family)
MTAFGRIRKEEAGFSVTMEIRTLNSRLLDIVLRLPKNLNEFEDMFRKQIAKSMRRGRVEVFVQVTSSSIDQKAPRLNLAVARTYWEQLLDLHHQLPGTDPPKLEDLLHIPYLFESGETEYDQETLKSLLNSTLEEALQQVLHMRILEGEALSRDCFARLASIEQALNLVEGRKDLVLREYQTRLQDRIQELLGDVQLDGNRLLQEVACFAERSDINEEIVRLRSHLNQLTSLLSGIKPADGRRIDFLSQELHREVNTIGCKTGDMETIQAVVQMKSEIGKLKEQVQNIE